MLVSATPQGIACLIITAVGFLNSANNESPALKSFKLLKESALPLSWLKNLSLLLQIVPGTCLTLELNY